MPFQDVQEAGLYDPDIFEKYKKTEPAPAITRQGPSTFKTASLWDLFNSSM